MRGKRGPWFLLNASPDLRGQLDALAPAASNGLRQTPVGGIVLSDAEIDHCAGLLLLRESNVPLRVWSTAAVREALRDGYPVLRMLERYCGVEWAPLEVGASVGLEGSSLEVEAFATGGDAPLYVEEPDGWPGSVGLTVRDRDGGAAVAYAPALASLGGGVTERLGASDCALVDGTFWSQDELIDLGIATRDAGAMGHVPLSGPSGSLAALSALAPRTILVHINNTNPILLEGSDERREVEASGIEVSYDGLELEL